MFVVGVHSFLDFTSNDVVRSRTLGRGQLVGGYKSVISKRVVTKVELPSFLSERRDGRRRQRLNSVTRPEKSHNAGENYVNKDAGFLHLAECSHLRMSPNCNSHSCINTLNSPDSNIIIIRTYVQEHYLSPLTLPCLDCNTSCIIAYIYIL